MKIYKCKECGKIGVLFDEWKCPTKCCGEAMVELVPNTEDGAHEKHIPVIEEKDGFAIVRVGEVAHPMTEQHLIELVVLHTDQGYKFKRLHANEVPEVKFALLDNEIVFSAYAYCNIHGLYKKSVE